MKNTLLICLMMMVLLFTTSCSSPETRLIGKWVGSTGTIEFFKDKTGLINPPKESIDLPPNVRFRWRVEGSDIVTIFVSAPGNRTFFAKLIDNYTLIVEEDKFVKQK